MGVRRREPVFGHHDPARGLALRCAAQVRARRGEPNAVAAAVEGDDGALGAGPPQPHGAGLGLPNSYTGRFLSAIEPGGWGWCMFRYTPRRQRRNRARQLSTTASGVPAAVPSCKRELGLPLTWRLAGVERIFRTTPATACSRRHPNGAAISPAPKLNGGGL